MSVIMMMVILYNDDSMTALIPMLIVDISRDVRRHSNDWRHLAYRAVIPLYHPAPLQSYWTTETFRIDCKQCNAYVIHNTTRKTRPESFGIDNMAA